MSLYTLEQVTTQIQLRDNLRGLKYSYICMPLYKHTMQTLHTQLGKAYKNMTTLISTSHLLA